MAKFDEDTTTITKPKIKKPSMYTAVFINDDYTRMDFVVKVLVEIFHQSHDEAFVIMMKVHKEGRCNVGSYTFEIAEHKVTQTMLAAKKSEFPLQVNVEAI